MDTFSPAASDPGKILEKVAFTCIYWENKVGLLDDVQKQEITGGPIC